MNECERVRTYVLHRQFLLMKILHGLQSTDLNRVMQKDDLRIYAFESEVSRYPGNIVDIEFFGKRRAISTRITGLKDFNEMAQTILEDKF